MCAYNKVMLSYFMMRDFKLNLLRDCSDAPFAHRSFWPVGDEDRNVCIVFFFSLFPYLLDCASEGFLSLCRLFLNQLLTWVKESPVILARFRFSAGDGYLFWL